MARTEDIQVPDIGGATDVEVIEILVKAGDKVSQEDPLITLEGDKATMGKLLNENRRAWKCRKRIKQKD